MPVGTLAAPERRAAAAERLLEQEVEAEEARHRVAMTGTPIENRVEDLLSEGRWEWTGARAYVHLDPRVMPAHVFRVRRSGETNQALTVHFAIRGTASNGVDYVRVPGQVTIPSGRRTARRGRRAAARSQPAAALFPDRFPALASARDGPCR